MSQKKTHEEFVNEVYNLVGDEYTVIGKYINAKTKIIMKHNICGDEYLVLPPKFTSSSKRCPKCAGNKKYDELSFSEKLLTINPNIQTVSKFINSRTKVKCKCLVCGNEWLSTPLNLISGRGCSKCSKQYRRSHDDFVNEMYDINKNIEILSNFKNTKTKIKCKCVLDDFIWETEPRVLLSGSGCPKCAGNLKFTNEEFLNRISIINPNIIVLSKYINYDNKVKYKCKKCNTIWYATPDNLLRGYGCPNCHISNGEDKIRLYLNHNNISFIQQYKFDGLVGVGKGLLSYDFYLPNFNLLIEYQGIQHEEPIEFFGGEEQFITQQEHDRRKREHANKHKIKLLEIWYWDFDNIEEILHKELGLKSDSYFVA